MRRFRIEKEDGSRLIVTLHQPPYEDDNILNKCGPSWSKKNVTITELKMYRGIEE
tara:strand:- start:104 stop:268 length:165 start_codon:yes stop_codon:yes gene_type:complete